MARHIEVGSLAAAEALIADIDASMGYPRLARGLSGQLLAAAQAWMAGDRSEPAPPGVTTTWARPTQHPTQPGRWSVVVETSTASAMPGLIGRTVAGIGPIGDDNAVDRTPDWVSRAER